jgi:hypothetical protein
MVKIMSLPKVSPAAMRCLVLFGDFLKAWGELPHGDEFGAVERLVTTALARVNWARGRPSGHPLEEAATCADELLDGAVYERVLAGIRKDAAGVRGE